MVLAITSVTFNTSTESEITSSAITWQAYKVTGGHAGTIDLQSSSIDFDADGKLTGGNFVIDMNTIAITDISGSSADKLRGHLMSDDFFSVEKYPTATLNITKVADKGLPGEYKVTADLTIKGKTKPVKFYTKVTEMDGMKKAVADIKVDRTDYNVQYGSGSFFSSLGDKTIYDEFDIKVELIIK